MRKEYLIILLAMLFISCGSHRSVRDEPIFSETEISFWEDYTISGVDIRATLLVKYRRGEIIDYYMLDDTLRLVLPDNSIINASLSSPMLGKEF